jgi:DNA-binding Lrp family transcriptional regulator
MIRDTGFELALIAIIGEGLPLVSRPYEAVAARLGCSEAEVIDGIRRISMRGDLKRFGVVVRHRRLGYRANGMVVWDIPDERIAETGNRIGGYDFVTLCYQRPRRLPEWRYNLFSMVHGRDRGIVEAQVERIADECGLRDVDYRILFSKRCFKQRGARYRQAADAPAPGDMAVAADG